jgi:nucleotide-binding universal stress UspA family protein
MYRRILVPTDLTDRTVKALEVAGNVAAPGDARITLLHVIETIAGLDFEELSSFYRKLERQASDRLEEIIARTPGMHVAVDTEIVYGRRAHPNPMAASEP